MCSGADERTAIVTGARGLVGLYLLPLLRERGYRVQALSRQARPGAATDRASPRPPNGLDDPFPPVRWIAADLAQPPEGATASLGAIGPARCLFHAAPIWLLPAWLPGVADAGVQRVVAFSSTSRFTKQGAPSPSERETARSIAEAEEAIQAACHGRGLRWTILRPTLIHGGGRDRNVSDIARFVRRFGCFPVAGGGRGKRQPVHAADLARAALAVLDNPRTFGRAYDTPGGETLTYAEMVSRIARGVGREPRLLHLPVPLLRGALSVASHLPGFGHLTPDMADRMNEDLVFDITAARRDFGYDPGPFRFPDEPEARSAP